MDVTPVSESRSPSIIDSLWRYRWSSLVIIALFLVMGLSAGLFISPPTQAVATIGLTPPPVGSVLSSGSGDASLSRHVEQRSLFVTSDAVMGSVAERLGVTDFTSLRRDVSVTPSTSSNAITVTAEAPSGADAVALANAVVEAYREETAKEVAELTALAVEAIEQQAAQIRLGLDGQSGQELTNSAAVSLSQLQLQASERTTEAALFGDGVDFVEIAREDAVITAGRPVREVALAAMLGLIVAGSVAWLRADRDRRVNSALQAELVLGAPFVGELESTVDLALPDGAPDVAALPTPAFRLVWSALQRLLELHSVVMVNAVGGARASSTAINVAVAAAREDLSVLLVDADLERSTLTRSLGLSGERRGVAALLENGGHHLDAEHMLVLPELGQIVVLPTGVRAGQELNFSRQTLGDLVNMWRKDFDLVVIDGAEVDSSPLPSHLAGMADDLLLVVPDGVDERSLLEFRRRAGLLGASMVGYVYAASPGWRWWRR